MPSNMGWGDGCDDVGICRAGPCLPAAVALPILAEAVPGEQGARQRCLSGFMGFVGFGS